MQSTGAVWQSQWLSWALVLNKPYGFCGPKETLSQPTSPPAPLKKEKRRKETTYNNENYVLDNNHQIIY